MKKPTAPVGEAPSAAAAKELKAAATERKPSSKVVLFAGIGAAVLALGAGAFYFLTKEPVPPPPKPRPAVAQQPKATPPPPTEAKPTEEKPAAPTTNLGKAVAKAQDVTAKVANGQTAATDEVLAADSTKSTPPPAANPSAAPTPTAANTRPAEPAPVEATPAVAPPAGVVAPSLAFRSWVQNLKISGVRGGANPRVFIERTAYAPGDLVNPQLGIYFESYNAETRKLTFKDKSGAIVERRN